MDKRLKLDFGKNLLEYLPLEILLKTCSYLNGEEIKNLRLVCKHWNEITQTREVGGRLRLKLISIVSNSVIDSINFFQNSKQKFYNIYLKRCNVDLLVPLFNIIGKCTKVLTIEDCHFSSDGILKDILNVTKNIDEIRIIYCSFHQCVIPNYGQIFKNIKILEILSKPVTKTKYEEVTNIIYNIQETSINCFTLNYVYKIFRGEHANNITHLLQMIRKNNKSLKELNLLDCCFTEEKLGVFFWESLIEIGCNLEKFSGSHISPKADSEKFIKFLIFQKNLKHLKLNNIRSLTDNVMENLVNNLNDLKEIELSNCVSLTDKGILFIKNLKQLNSFNINYNTEFEVADKVTITPIINGIAQGKNGKLDTLSLCNIKMTIDQLHDVTKNLPNLRKLKYHSVKTNVQNEGLEVSKILSNNKLLSHLSFGNYKPSIEKMSINQSSQKTENQILKTLEISYSESCRELLSSTKFPNLRNLKILYLDDTRQKDSGKEFIKALHESSPSVEYISLTVMSDIDIILDFILTSFKKLKNLKFDWHCGDCLLYKRIHIKTNQRLHPLLKNSQNFQFDESCERCNNLFSKLKCNPFEI